MLLSFKSGGKRWLIGVKNALKNILFIVWIYNLKVKTIQVLGKRSNSVLFLCLISFAKLGFSPAYILQNDLLEQLEQHDRGHYLNSNRNKVENNF